MQTAQILGTATLLAAASGRPSDRGEIEEIVHHYFRAGDEGSPAELEKAFHPTLGMFWILPDGSVGALGRAAWARRLSGGRPDPARLRRIDEVILDGDIASARLHSEFQTHQFDDFVSLVRLEGGWRIVLKTFHRRAPADAPLPGPEAQAAERDAIRRLLEARLRSLDAGDDEGLAHSALDRAIGFTVEKGELVAVSAPEARARLADQRAAGGIPRVARRVEAVWTAVDVALGRITQASGDGLLVEHVSLLRTREGWRIVGLVYASGPRPTRP